MFCKSCHQEKHGSHFYVSNRSRCKECVKASVRENRLANIEHYREFDRNRASNPERVAARNAYNKTPEGKLAHARATRKWVVSNALRRKAQNIVANALKYGRLTPQPCFICGEHAQAHHPDYDRPLSVTWLCPKHHKEAHKIAANDAYYCGEKETLH